MLARVAEDLLQEFGRAVPTSAADRSPVRCSRTPSASRRASPSRARRSRPSERRARSRTCAAPLRSLASSVDVRADLAGDECLPSLNGPCPEMNTRFPVRTAGTYAATGATGVGSSMPSSASLSSGVVIVISFSFEMCMCVCDLELAARDRAKIAHHARHRADQEHRHARRSRRRGSTATGAAMDCGTAAAIRRSSAANPPNVNGPSDSNRRSTLKRDDAGDDQHDADPRAAERDDPEHRRTRARRGPRCRRARSTGGRARTRCRRARARRKR